jgi:drug/metabolite transporter (DMT)-like permease
MLLIGLIVYGRIALPITASLLRLHLTTGLVGMVIPGAAFFYAAAHVPAGVLSITIGMVPILTYIASTFLGLEKFAMGRIFGVILGAFAVVLLVAPESSLPDPGQLPWAFLGFVAAVCYAALGIVLALAAPRGANSLMLTCGMFVVGSLVMMPILYMTDSFVPFGWPLGVVEWSPLGLGAVNAVAYTLYFILVDRARTRLHQLYRQHGDALRRVVGNSDIFRAELDLGVAVLRYDNDCDGNGRASRKGDCCRGRY